MLILKHKREIGTGTLDFCFEAAEKLEDMDLPGPGLHPLKGNRKGTWAVKVSGNWRITFEIKTGENDHIPSALQAFIWNSNQGICVFSYLTISYRAGCLFVSFPLRGKADNGYPMLLSLMLAKGVHAVCISNDDLGDVKLGLINVL